MNVAFVPSQQGYYFQQSFTYNYWVAGVQKRYNFFRLNCNPMTWGVRNDPTPLGRVVTRSGFLTTVKIPLPLDAAEVCFASFHST